MPHNSSQLNTKSKSKTNFIQGQGYRSRSNIYDAAFQIANNWNADAQTIFSEHFDSNTTADSVALFCTRSPSFLMMNYDDATDKPWSHLLTYFALNFLHYYEDFIELHKTHIFHWNVTDSTLYLSISRARKTVVCSMQQVIVCLQPRASQSYRSCWRQGESSRAGRTLMLNISRSYTSTHLVEWKLMVKSKK